MDGGSLKVRDPVAVMGFMQVRRSGFFTAVNTGGTPG
jgi:hypothetical protein